MAFGGFNSGLQAKILQQQIRGQLGIPPQGLGLSAPQATTRGPGGVLGAQLADQQAAQNTLREIAAETSFVNGQRGFTGAAPQNPYTQGRPAVGNYQQMGFMLQMLMKTMMAMTQLRSGFSTFAGGPAHQSPYR